jgi:hypothetical protein
MGRSFRLWQEVYAFRGHGCDGTGWDGDAILVIRPVKSYWRVRMRVY